MWPIKNKNKKNLLYEKSEWLRVHGYWYRFYQQCLFLQLIHSNSRDYYVMILFVLPFCLQSFSRAMMNITLGKHCLFSIGFRHSLRYISYNTPSDSKKKVGNIQIFFMNFPPPFWQLNKVHKIKMIAATASSIQFLPLILCFEQLVHVMNPA